MLKVILGLLLLALFSTPSSADDRYFDVHAAGKKHVGKGKHASRRHVAVRPPRAATRRYAQHRAVHPPKAGARQVARKVVPKVQRPFQHRRIAWRLPPPAGGQAAVVHRVGPPAGCPARAWCGCFLAKLLGLNHRHLWVAKNWATVGRPAAPQPGAIVVWRHHVGKVVAVAGNKIRVLSGNDGRAVRERWRSARGVIAYRML